MNLIKRKAINLLERAAAKKGTVLEVRPWVQGDIFEVDLHLPGANMGDWEAVQHIKVKVSEAIYRDYSPTMWDEETCTCTLIIDAGHDGPGSIWVNNLKKGDTLTYLGVGPTNHKPSISGNAFCIGDTSSIGHFLAMEQLVTNQVGFSGFIVFNKPAQMDEFQDYFNTALAPISASGLVQIYKKIKDYNLSNQTIYIAGNTPVMSQIRKYIRHIDGFYGTVKLQGFWD